MAATVPVSEVKSNTRESRTAAHSHIKGLGLKGPDGHADTSGGGFIGQAAAREVLHTMCTLGGMITDGL
jgi:RuvB-like protein 1 (pontin 52)